MNDQNSFLPKNAAYFRARGRRALKGHWGIAIGAMFLAGICGAFSSIFSFDMDLEDFGIRANDLANPSFYSADTLRELLARIDANRFAILLSISVFAILTSIAWRLFVGSPVFLGYQKLHLDLIDEKPLSIKTLFDYFRTGYLKSVVLRLLLALIEILCSLPVILASGVGILLCLPAIRAFLASEALVAQDFVMISLASLLMGLASIATTILSIVIGLRYSYAFVILAEYPELTAVEALQKSRSLMQGNKWRLFCLEISFIGWYLLSAFFTCGLGFIWAVPYRNAAVMAFYDDIANRKAAADAEFPSLNPDDYTTDSTF